MQETEISPSFLMRTALRDADQMTDLLMKGKRVPQSMSEDLRNHVRKLSKALETHLHSTEALVNRIADIAGDFVPDHDRDAPQALQEMREALMSEVENFGTSLAAKGTV